ncbi:MAG: hypothetical protein J6W94_04080 [Bacteroidales bacterium]|nr:hypothetical protein [Bacteroidales bacterium]MBP5676172.1 hypothetical protein [Bacteroidales bacterium]
MKRFSAILLLLISWSLGAVEVRFVNYGSREGLPSNSVYAIAQDAGGALWVGTRGGLCRFDGARFRVWKEPGRVNALALDRDHRLWLGTADGLHVKDGDSFIPGPSGNIRALLSDSEGYIWATVGDTLLLKLSWADGIREEARCWYDKRDSEGDYPYYQLFEASDGKIWPAGRIVRMQYVQDRRNPEVVHPLGHGGFCPGSFTEADGRFYVFEDHTSLLYIMDGRDIIPLGRLPVAHARLLTDSRGRVWAAGSYGLALVNTDRTEDSRVYKTASNELYCIFEDRQGNIWVGGDNGLSVLCPELQLVHTVSSANVTALLEDHCGKLWVGTADQRISCLYEDSTGAVYTGLWNNTGWVVRKDGRVRKERISGPTPREQWPSSSQNYDGANWISDFLEDSQGRFWVVTWEGVGLNQWDRKSGKALPARWLSPFRYPTPQIDSNIYLSSRLGSRLIEDTHGNLVYATTEAGLNIIDGRSGLVTKYYRGNSDIPDDYVTDLCLSPDGAIWAATRSGLWSPSGGHFLDGMLVQSVEADASGRLWAGTEDGLYFIDSDGSVGRAGKELGFPSDIYGEHVSCKLSGGRLAFGGADGAAVFHPDSLLAINASGSLPLAPLVHHRYRVNSGEWVGEEFSGLPDNLMPGRYTLETQSSDVFGRWDRSPGRKSVIRVRPPLPLRWPFLLVYLLLLGSAVWLFVRYRENRQRALVLQEELDTRNRFFGIISHDLRNPVSGIKTLAGALEDAPEGKLREGVRAISREASHTSSLLENLLMWSVMQKEVLRPVIREVPLADIVREAAGMRALETHIPDGFTVQTDPNMLTTCIRNLLDNAFRFSPDYVRLDASTGKIVISDHGPGMDAETLRTLRRPGHLGLAITGELLEKMGASLSARNLSEGGCEITITL